MGSADAPRVQRAAGLRDSAHALRRARGFTDFYGGRASQILRLAARHGFIVDFFAPAARLVVEVDGAQHTRQRGADRRRDTALAGAGLSVVRLPAQLVLCSLPEAVQIVIQALRQ